ncbi:MAG: heavy-metal-associated domain-containing protein [Bacteroidales bacterium]|nr:heavy-metal-associated domain-containing protein [Bacteroidales bacterium]MCF8404573.1 heavy-metal-associated domain-containing protein [Bacteroidales bacterium]
MRTTILILAFASFLISGVKVNTVEAEDNNFTLSPGEKKTETVKVYGNCGMCQARIEKAAKSVDGVKKAQWDKEKKELTLTFDPELTSVEAIEKEIAAVGHDTENVKAKDEVYNNLHSCCQYDRPEVK